MALLGLLEREPSHGYDLKRDYDIYFGRGRPLPFGQVYATLARLASDGKAVVGRGGTREPVLIASATRSPRPGGTRSRRGWPSRSAAEPHLQTDLFVKVVLSLMLGRPAEKYLDVQRAAHLARMRELTDLKQKGRSSTRCSPTMVSSTWRPICAGSTSPPAGSPCWRRRWRHDLDERFLRGPGRRRISKPLTLCSPSARPRRFVAPASPCSVARSSP